MRDVWARIDQWIEANAPEAAEGLDTGAYDTEIAETEAFLGITFPQEVRNSYAIHNGQPNRDAPGALPGGEFLSLQRICDEWGIWKGLLDSGTFADSKSQPSGPIREDWWHPAWIPITHDGSGNHYCLDFAPAEGGTVGQVIKFWHDDPERIVVATGLRAWLEAYAGELESGEYVYSDDYYGIVHKRDVVDEE